MDVLSKVLCRIMNKRLFKLLEKNGTNYQFGATLKTGCREGIFTLKTALHIRRNHNLGTHVAFIDLVKAFDTADHNLLIRVLKKYGAPPELCDCVKRLYERLMIVLKSGKIKIETLQSVGVKQGDNMAPVLFLFIMAAMMQLLDDIWERENMEKVEFLRESDDFYRKGQLARHNIS